MSDTKQFTEEWQCIIIIIITIITCKKQKYHKEKRSAQKTVDSCPQTRDWNSHKVTASQLLQTKIKTMNICLEKETLTDAKSFNFIPKIPTWHKLLLKQSLVSLLTEYPENS